MKKLKLVLDELRVETFATVDGTGRRGTVVGQSPGMSDECRTNGPDACMGSLYCLSNEVICAPTDGNPRSCDTCVVSDCLEC